MHAQLIAQIGWYIALQPSCKLKRHCSEHLELQDILARKPHRMSHF